MSSGGTVLGSGFWLLLISLVLILLNTLVVMPQTEQQTGLELAQKIFNLFVFLCVFSSGVTGLWAIVMERERSWVLFIALLSLVLAIGLNVGSLVNG
jgi:hypothetical protein